ncbi:MAG TPA: YbhB/YbcL family Raf kinase inhibitor-like protein [Terracidiphilus sp.]|nr:YbhB/YbcL family Raf kinase inhibitor-like protein [Terracidiphilus sp.]
MGAEAKKTPLNSRLMLTAAVTIAVLSSLFAFLFLRSRRTTPIDVEAGASMELKSTSFPDGASIPSRYTCDGAGVSPSLEWSGAPAATKSFALILHDPDAPVDFTHWLAYDIPGDLHQLAEGASTDGAMPKGAVEGMNGFRRMGYGGPCPPAGKPHRYIFLLYALDESLGLTAGATREQVESAMRSHIVASGKLTGTYSRGE